MKRLILIILLLCLTLPAYGQEQMTRLTAPMTGGGVVAAGAPTYGIGDLLTERFTAIGTWAETVEGDGDTLWNQTTISGTGFANHMTAVGTADFQAYVSKDIGAQSAVFFRFYYQVNSESWGDGIAEHIFTLAPNGGTIANDTYMTILLRQKVGGLELYCYYAGGSSFTTGSTVLDVSTGTVYKIEGKVVDDGATGTAEWKVDGSVIGTRTGHAGLGAVAIQDVFIGISYNAAASSHSFDTLDISSTAYLTDTP